MSVIIASTTQTGIVVRHVLSCTWTCDSPECHRALRPDVTLGVRGTGQKAKSAFVRSPLLSIDERQHLIRKFSMESKQHYVALLMPVAARALLADHNQRKSNPVCKLLEVNPAKTRVLPTGESDGAPLSDSAEEGARHE